MPSREKRLAMEARAAEQREAAKTDPGVALMLKKKRTAIRKMLATRAAKKAAAALAEPGPEKAAADAAEHELLDTIQARQPDPPLTLRGTPRKTPEELLAESTFAQRVDLRLQQIGKTRRELEEVLGVAHATVASWHRTGHHPRAARLTKVAEFLGVTVEWLREGGDAPSQLIPHAAAVFKANGKHHASHEGRIEAAMQANVDTTITALWSLLPMDAKVMVIARVAELVAMQGRK